MMTISVAGGQANGTSVMGWPNGELDSWADWIVGQRFRYVQVNGYYDQLGDADELYTTAHLKPADAYLQTLDDKTRQSLSTFDAVDNALRRIVDPQVRDLFLKSQPQAQPKDA